MTSQTFNLDLIPQGVPPIVHVSQYDKGQTWNIHLFENGVVFPVPSGTSAAVQGTKPDNTGFQYPAVISVGDNVVTFTVEQQMTVLGGQFECELVLVNGENQVATINFILDVEPTTLDDDTVISETELPLIEQAAELGAVINGYATQIHADAETASTAATTATAAATSASADAATATQAADDAAASQTAAATSETNAAASATAAASSESNAATSEANAAASAAEAARVAATDMAGATASTAGTHGLVPAPAAGDNDKFLGGDGTWKDVPAELSRLTDVVLTNPADGQLLRYNATSQKWENAGVDSTPTANSANLVSSGGVKAELDSMSSQIGDIENFLTISEVDITQFSNASGHLRLRRFGRIVIMQIDLTPTNANNVQVDLPNGYEINSSFFHQVTYKNNHIYVYGYANLALNITHTTNDIIELVVPYICTP